MLIRSIGIALIIILTSIATSGQQTWRPALPAARQGHAMAYDSTRGVPVFFGGWTSDDNGETWTWNGSTWIPRQVTGPHARGGHAMAFDSVRQAVVLHGGTWGLANAETWSWNGTSWTSNGTAGPSGRFGHAMAFDSFRGVMVLFGGQGNGVTEYFDDTWEWTGIWTRRVVTGPSRRSGHSMAYDSVRRVTLLLGAPSGGSNELWAWNGTAWTMLAVGGPPLPSVPWKMTFDTVRGVAVACGGAIDTPVQTWEWNGTQWNQRVAVGPIARYSAAISYDVAHQVTVLYGGANSLNRVTGETWEWDGVSWTQRGASPPDVSGMEMTFDNFRNRAIVFGGEYPTSTPGTWEWDGITWWKQVANGPIGRGSLGLAFDESRNITLLFGGYTTQSGAGSNGHLGDTWEWDGTTWTHRSVPGPGARRSLKLAYDAARHVVVLFGGIHSSSTSTTYFGDTWEWDGATWLLRGTTGPSPRYGHGMAFDNARSVTVLFGGLNGNGYQNDTWEWNGIQWTQRPVTGPSVRSFPGMTYNRARQRCVLFGGMNASAILSDTWEWNGTGWSMTTATGPTNRDRPAMAYDTARNAIVLLSGVVVTVPSVDTWRFAATGCAPPTILLQPPNRVACLNGTADFSLTVQGSSPRTFQWQWKEAGLVWRDIVEGDNADLDGTVRFNATGTTIQQLSLSRGASTTSDLRRVAAVRCSIANGCGSIVSAAGYLDVCTPDFNCDSAVDFFDYLDFVGEFASQTNAADFNSDGVVDFFDYLDFVVAFSVGC